jgi:exodeoxyribonuclease-3
MNKLQKTIISWNVNGLRAVAKKGFLDWFKDVSPDILCLQEIKAQEDQLTFELKIIENYSVKFSSAKRKGYSGVATYTMTMPIKIETSIENNDFDEEGRVIISKYKEFTLINVYFPNGNMNSDRLKFKMDFYEHILEYLRSLLKTEKNIIICGDVNTAHKEIDLFHPKENSKHSGFLPIEREWIDRLLDIGFIDSFRQFINEAHQYTWWDLKSRARDRNIGWRLDYFFISNNLEKNLRAAFILPEVFGSDHCPIGITLEF